MATRVSHEALVLPKLWEALAGLPCVTYATGMGASNRFPLDGWRLVGLQQFQFGDLRIETSTATIVVEAESGGGVTNLAKYWPYLEADPRSALYLERATQLLLLYVGPDLYRVLVHDYAWTHDDWIDWTVATVAEQVFARPRSPRT